MLRMGCLQAGTLATLLISIGMTAAAAAHSVEPGTYAGTYVCSQGSTKVTLEFFDGNRQDDGRFAFDTGRVAGAYRFKVSESNGFIFLNPTVWEKQPRGFNTVGARVQKDGSQLSGVLLSPSCGAITVRRAGAVTAATRAGSQSGNAGAEQSASPTYLLGDTSTARRITQYSAKGLTPITDVEARQVADYLALTRRANGGRVEPGSVKFSRFVSMIAPKTIMIEYDYTYLATGKTWTLRDMVDRHPDGGACVWDRVAFEQDCESLVTSESEAERLSVIAIAKGRQAEKDRPERERQEKLAEQKAGAELALASQRREPGAPLNAQDRACLVVRTEPRVLRTTTSKCLEIDYTPQGGQCARYAVEERDVGVPYEVNKCNYTIRFKDLCGRSIFAENAVAPGARFDAKFQAPCSRVY